MNNLYILMTSLVIAVQFQARVIGVSDPCSNKPCKNNGLCTAIYPNGYHCQCPEGFTGKNCEECVLIDHACYAKRCPVWAYKNECKKNAKWMKRNCGRSCGCGCIDHNSHCKVWADRGECNKNPTYMKPFCPKSCCVCL